MINKDETFTYEYLPWCGISKETMSVFDTKTKINESGEPVSIGFPYGENYLVRAFGEKRFRWVGPNPSAPELFGRERFAPGSARSITVTEGAKDALSVYEILKHPVVSVRSASTARKDCAAHRDYLNSFEKIYLSLDNDEAGQKAVREVAQLFDNNKVYHVKHGQHKDANDFLAAGAGNEYKKTWWNSRRFLPEGVVSSYAAFDEILDTSENKKGEDIPFPTLNGMLGGLVTGKSYLFTALEGVGKTELMRALEYNLLKNTDHNVCVIHIEEEKDEQLKRLAGQELQLPVHLEDSPISRDEVKAALRTLTKRDERLHLYSHFGSDDPEVILDLVRFLVAVCGCRFVFLDHITMVVTGLMGDDERKQLDYLSSRLEMMVKELDFCLIFVSHVNDDGLTRGSRNISKVADKWVHLSRNMEALDELERHTIRLSVKKNRGRHQTGPAGLLWFDADTYTLSELGELPA